MGHSKVKIVLVTRGLMEVGILDEIIKLLQDGTQQGKNSFSDTRVDGSWCWHF